MLTDTSKSNSTLGTQLHAIIRTHFQLRHQVFDINTLIRALMTKTSRQKNLTFCTFSGICPGGIKPFLIARMGIQVASSTPLLLLEY